MTAASAAGDAFPPFYLGTMLASTPDDDEAWVLQAPGPRFPKISTSTSHGTSKAIATHVENSPFLPLDNWCHETNRSTAPAPTPSSFMYNSRISTIDDAKPTSQYYDLDKGFSLIICKCPFAFCRGNCPTAASLSTPSALCTRPITSHSISVIKDAQPEPTTFELPQRKPVDLAAIRHQLRENMANLERLSPPSMTTTMILIPTRQPDPQLPTPTPFPTTPTVLPRNSPTYHSDLNLV